MRVAVIDVGSNTVRLLVADAAAGALTTVREERTFLGLAAAIAETGAIGGRKLAEAAEAASRFAASARTDGADRLAAVVTAPGRAAADAAVLVAMLRHATRVPVRVLSAEEEGRLAFEGAVARAGRLPEVVGVVDVGGGSTELAVGTPLLGAAWVHSAGVGSLTLTHRYLRADPPGERGAAAARAAARRALAGVRAPRPDVALAVGGSARALARVAGPRFDAGELEAAAARLVRRSAAENAARLGLDARRTRTLAAGALLLAEASRVLERSLELGRGGLREGAALALAAGARRAAA